jgi:hypothetical protein
MSTLRRSPVPDPSPPTLPASKAPDQTVLRPVPDAPKQRRPAAVVKRSLLDDGENRRTIKRREQHGIDIEGRLKRAFRSLQGRRVPRTWRIWKHRPVIEVIGPLDAERLAAILMARGVRPDAYQLCGGHPPERYILDHRGNEWLVYYSEHGLESGSRRFPSEDLAYRCLLDVIDRDRTTKR